MLDFTNLSGFLIYEIVSDMFSIVSLYLIYTNRRGSSEIMMSISLSAFGFETGFLIECSCVLDLHQSVTNLISYCCLKLLCNRYII